MTRRRVARRARQGLPLRRRRRDHAAWSDFVLDTQDSGDGWLGGPKIQVASNQTYAPAMADQGALAVSQRRSLRRLHPRRQTPRTRARDSYEVAQQLIQKFNYQYPFTYYRRQRRDWNYLALPSQTAMNVFERLRSFHWIVDFNIANEQAARRRSRPGLRNWPRRMTPSRATCSLPA